MASIHRSIAAAALLVASVGLAGSAANAAPAGPFGPLQPLMSGSETGIQQIDYRHRWGRRCYRECHVGRHGRLFCTWHCYRPRRWW